MTRPTLTLALASVLGAAVEGAGRPALLTTLHPEFGRTVGRRHQARTPGMAQLIHLPRVIPMPHRERALPDSPEQADPEPDPSAA
jgi:hypothetical protein